MFKFINRYRYLFILVLYVILMVISYRYFMNTNRIIEYKYEQIQSMVESSILKSFKNVNQTYKIAEIEIDQKMNDYSNIMVSQYAQNPDIGSWDLESLKQTFGGYEIYIIDSQHKVIRSTYQPDVGLDFSQYTSFAALLDTRIQGDSFVVDALDVGMNTGKLQKYSYMPTSDHTYLLELSVDINQVYPGLNNLNLFTEANSFTEQYPSVSAVEYYKYDPYMGNIAKLVENQPVSMDVAEPERSLIETAYNSGQTESAVQAIDGITYTHTFIPISLEETAKTEWWKTILVGVTYNNERMLAELGENQNLFILNMFILTCAFASYFLIVTYLLRRFEHMAYHDTLTDLPNRANFEHRITDFIENDTGHKKKMAILFIDINRFKQINDQYGHDVGDEIIKTTGQKLKDSLRRSDFISRIGGDEFVIGLPDLKNADEVQNVIDRIVQIFNEPVKINQTDYRISISIGVSMYPEQGENLEELIKNADDAMYQAKQSQSHICFYKQTN